MEKINNLMFKMSKSKIKDISVINTDTDKCNYLITPELEIIINSSKTLNFTKNKDKIQRISTDKKIEYSTDEYMRLGMYQGFKYFLDVRINHILNANPTIDEKTLDSMVDIILNNVMQHYSALLSCFKQENVIKRIKTNEKKLQQEVVYGDVLKHANVSNIKM